MVEDDGEFQDNSMMDLKAKILMLRKMTESSRSYLPSVCVRVCSRIIILKLKTDKKLSDSLGLRKNIKSSCVHFY